MAIDFIAYYNEIFLNKIVSSVIILLLGLMLGRVFGKITRKILHELDINLILTRIIRLNFERIISNLISYLIYLATVIIILNRLDITDFIWKSVIIVLGIIIFSDLLLHLKDFLPNLYAYSKLRKEFIAKKRIETYLTKGEIKSINPISTKIIRQNGDVLYIQNKTILNKGYKLLD